GHPSSLWSETRAPVFHCRAGGENLIGRVSEFTLCKRSNIDTGDSPPSRRQNVACFAGRVARPTLGGCPLRGGPGSCGGRGARRRRHGEPSSRITSPRWARSISLIRSQTN